jgi:hypothetical protein
MRMAKQTAKPMSGNASLVVPAPWAPTTTAAPAKAGTA